MAKSSLTQRGLSESGPLPGRPSCQFLHEQLQKIGKVFYIDMVFRSAVEQYLAVRVKFFVRLPE
jgi:hypothetical protein